MNFTLWVLVITEALKRLYFMLHHNDTNCLMINHRWFILLVNSSFPRQIIIIIIFFLLSPWKRLTSDLLLQAEDDGHCLVQHQQLRLRLLALQVHLTHVAELLEGLIDVAHPQPLTGVVCHAPLALPLGLLLGAEVLVLVDAADTFN